MKYKDDRGNTTTFCVTLSYGCAMCSGRLSLDVVIVPECPRNLVRKITEYAHMISFNAIRQCCEKNVKACPFQHPD